MHRPDAQLKPRYFSVGVLFAALVGGGGYFAYYYSDLANLNKKGSEQSTTQKKEEKEDPWKSVHFGYREFKKTIALVEKHYINPVYDRNVAFIYAANFALHSLKAPQEIVPVEFYNKHKDLPDERSMLAGPVKKLEPKDAYYVHTFEKKAQEKEKEKNKDRILTDEEIIQKVNQEKERQRLLNASWKPIKFGQSGFEKIMNYIMKATQKDKDYDIKTAYILAAQGYLSWLDPHSGLISAKEWQESTKKIQDSSFEGIGALLRREGKFVLIETPLNEHQPSYKAGLLPGDLIIKVDNKVIEGVALHKVVSWIKGPKGTTVVLNIRRKGHPKDFDVKIVRAYVQIKNVESRLLPELSNVGYIKVTGFIDTTLREILTHYQQLYRTSQGNIRGLVLDLRNNAGGKLDGAIGVGDLFLSRGGHVVSIKYAPTKKPRTLESFVAKIPSLIPVPMVVLVNARSASASEIVASAIQDNSRGFIIGVKSYGKGSVQNLLPMPNRIAPKWYVKLTIALFLRKYMKESKPVLDSVQVKGVQPDFMVRQDPKKLYYFREESSPRHLDPISADPAPRKSAAIKKVQGCMDKSGTAKKTIQAMGKNPKLKPDRQLFTGVDVLRCMISEKVYTKIRRTPQFDIKHKRRVPASLHLEQNKKQTL